MLYEGWACHYNDSLSRWECGSGAKFDLKRNSYGQRPDGWTSAEAAGMPMSAGILRYSEVAAGEVRHALRFSTACTTWNYIKPASHSSVSPGCDGFDPTVPPMGTRIRLKANFDISGFSPQIQVVLRALKKYGALLGDNNPGSAGYTFQADHDAGWAPGQLYELWKIPNTAFEVVQTYQ